MSTPATTGVKDFQPPSVQNYNALNPEYAHRFVDTNPGNKRGDRLRYWQNQGWEVAPYGNDGMKGNRPTGASSMDGAVHYRGLVLVRIKKEIADARNKFYREKHQRLINASQTVRRLAGLTRQRGAGDMNTSAFAESTREQDRGGRRVTISESAVDTRRGEPQDQERIMRDADQGAIKELNERMEQVLANQKKLEDENARLRAEIEERAKKPSDRKRRSFPVS